MCDVVIVDEGSQGDGVDVPAEDVRNTAESDRHKFFETSAKAATLVADREAGDDDLDPNDLGQRMARALISYRDMADRAYDQPIACAKCHTLTKGTKRSPNAVRPAVEHFIDCALEDGKE